MTRPPRSWLLFRIVSLTPLITGLMGIACAGFGIASHYELIDVRTDPTSSDRLIRFGTALSIPGIICVLLAAYSTFRTRLLKRRKTKRQATESASVENGG